MTTCPATGAPRPILAEVPELVAVSAVKWCSFSRDTCTRAHKAYQKSIMTAVYWWEMKFCLRRHEHEACNSFELIQ